MKKIIKKLSHIDKQGRAKMVDVSGKPVTKREAVASGSVSMKPSTLKLIMDQKVPKGDVLTLARIAGIMAAKKAGELIPLCHPLNITSVDIDFTLDKEKSRIDIETRVKTSGQTGVEMEALTAVNVALLTVYDMCKAVDKNMEMGKIKLISKTKSDMKS